MTLLFKTELSKMQRNGKISGCLLCLLFWEGICWNSLCDLTRGEFSNAYFTFSPSFTTWPCAIGASERTEQQKKSHGFEDELSEVLESQSNTNTERGWCQHNPHKIQAQQREPRFHFKWPCRPSCSTSEVNHHSGVNICTPHGCSCTGGNLQPWSHIELPAL